MSLKIERDALPMYNAHGAAAKYWRLGRFLGMKAYNREDERDECYDLQRFGAKRGLAPALIGRFEIKTPEKRLHALLTEHVPLTGHGYRKKHGEKEAMRMHRRLRSLAIGCWGAWGDDHAGNWGVMADAKPVVLDFSWHSFGNDSKRKVAREMPVCSAFVSPDQVAGLISQGVADWKARELGYIDDGQEMLALAAEVAKAEPRVAQVGGVWRCPAEWQEAKAPRKNRVRIK